MFDECVADFIIQGTFYSSLQERISQQLNFIFIKEFTVPITRIKKKN